MTARALPFPEARRFALFLVAGGVNTVFGYAVYAGLLWAGFSYTWAAGLGMIAGVAFNFKTIGAVFAARGFARLPQFMLIYAALMPANILLLHGLVTHGLGPYTAEAIVIAIVSPVSFLLMRQFVFAPNDRLSRQDGVA